MRAVPAADRAGRSAHRDRHRQPGQRRGEHGRRELKLGGLPAAPGTGSYWFIGCDLAPFTGILSYFVNEQP